MSAPTAATSLAERVFYSTSPPLTRAAVTDADVHLFLKDDANTLLIPTSCGKSFVYATDQQPVFLSPSQAAVLASHPSPLSPLLVYLGHSSSTNKHYVAADYLDASSLPQRLLEQDVISDNLRNVADSISSWQEAALLAHARGMTHWHRSTAFCALCGGKMSEERGGSCRRCQACKKSAYPRIEPAVIMLVTNKANTHCLLGRKKQWTKGRFSCLAGFTELGETFEQTVARETKEESGVGVVDASVKYRYSQPWPFPSSLMIGFTAVAVEEAEDGDEQGQGKDPNKASSSSSSSSSSPLPAIAFDKEEMDDVKWFSKHEVQQALSAKSGDLHFPGQSSLARILIQEWCST